MHEQLYKLLQHCEQSITCCQYYKNQPEFPMYFELHNNWISPWIVDEAVRNAVILLCVSLLLKGDTVEFLTQLHISNSCTIQQES